MTKTGSSSFVPHPVSDEPASFESLLVGAVKAGFPSPAEDVREKLDLVKLLVRHTASTFFFQVDGVSMVDADMDEGDILIVDRAVDPYNGCKAVCFIDGEYTVKLVEIGEAGIFLLDGSGFFKIYGGDRLISLNPDYGPILLKDFADVQCRGRVIGRLRRK